jgi:hypothetical protein
MTDYPTYHHIKPEHSWFDDRELLQSPSGDHRIWREVGGKVLAEYRSGEAFSVDDAHLTFSFLATEGAGPDVALPMLATPIPEGTGPVYRWKEVEHPGPRSYEELFNTIGVHYEPDCIIVLDSDGRILKQVAGYPDSCWLKLEYREGTIHYSYHR